MTPSELRSHGEPFPGWQSRLARCLKVNPRTVRSWVSGRSRITPQMEMLILQQFEDWRKQQRKAKEAK